MQKANYEWNTRVNKLCGLKSRNCGDCASISMTAHPLKSRMFGTESGKVTEMITWASDPSALHSCRHLSPSAPTSNRQPKTTAVCNMTMTFATFTRRRWRKEEGGNQEQGWRGKVSLCLCEWRKLASAEVLPVFSTCAGEWRAVAAAERDGGRVGDGGGRALIQL